MSDIDLCVVQGSATLSMAYAGALFADSCLRGLNGDSNVFDYSYVDSDVTDVPFFSSRIDLGPEGTCLLVWCSVLYSASYNS